MIVYIRLNIVVWKGEICLVMSGWMCVCGVWVLMGDLNIWLKVLVVVLVKRVLIVRLSKSGMFRGRGESVRFVVVVSVMRIVRFFFDKVE